MNEVGRGIWQAQRVRLRAIEPADWPIYFAWNQDDEQARSLAAIPFPQSEEAVRQWAPRESTRTATDDGYRLVIEDARGEVVGMLPARKFPVFSVSRRPGDREKGRDVAQVVANGGVADDDRANAARWRLTAPCCVHEVARQFAVRAIISPTRSYLGHRGKIGLGNRGWGSSGMDGSHFDAWTRRRFGAVAVGVAAGLLVPGAHDETSARRKKKKKKRKRQRTSACEELRTRCNPHNTRELCCGGLACGVVAGLDGHRCCRLRYSECTVNDDCCNNLRCVGGDAKHCDV